MRLKVLHIESTIWKQEAGSSSKVIVGSASKAEYQGNTGNLIKFTAHGIADNAVVSFPYTIIYDISNDSYSYENDYIDQDSTAFWGRSGPRSILKDLDASNNIISMTFGFVGEKSGSPYKASVPFTQVFFDTNENEYVVCMYQTDIPDEVLLRPREIESGSLINLKVEKSQMGLLHKQPVDYFWLSGHKLTDIRNEDAVILRVKVPQGVCFTSLNSIYESEILLGQKDYVFRIEFKHLEKVIG